MDAAGPVEVNGYLRSEHGDAVALLAEEDVLVSGRVGHDPLEVELPLRVVEAIEIAVALERVKGLSDGVVGDDHW